MFVLNKFGFYLLLLLLSMIPFHFAINEFISLRYYREIIGVLFSILLLVNLFHQQYISLKVRKEIFFLVLFPILLTAAFFYDPGVKLYPNDSLLAATEVINIDPRIYILRNSFLFLPMILYLAVRGISKEEIRNIAIVSVAIAPFSILVFLLSLFKTGGLSIFLLAEVAQNPFIFSEYNTYVPYLSFPFISGIYLLSDKNSSLLKSLTLISIAIITIFIFLSSSRQTLLFIAIALFLYLIFDKAKNTKKIILFSVGTLFIFIAYQWIMSGYEINNLLVNKYSEGFKTTRLRVMLDGLQRMDPFHYLMGSGLTSVVNSGPHNDYIRWVQRVGLLFMIIAFIPYFLASYKCFIRLRQREANQVIFMYIWLAIFFILYHSLFGHPREDVYESVWSFLGIAIWLAYTKQGSNKVMKVTRV